MDTPDWSKYIQSMMAVPKYFKDVPGYFKFCRAVSHLAHIVS